MPDYILTPPRRALNGAVRFMLVLMLSAAASYTRAGDYPYSLVVSKSEQELLIKQGEEVIKRFRVSVGSGGSGNKRRSGDNKTPAGSYRIMEFKPDSKFHFFMLINYPNSVDAWHGYKDNLISASQFKEIVLADKHSQVPPQDTRLGGYIGLHGIGEITNEKLSIHDKHNWTEGCIALTNEEISELRRYVNIGTPLLIKE
jgi:murein L,D-transpeptidase YafK